MLKPLTRSCAVAMTAAVLANAAMSAPLVRSDDPAQKPAFVAAASVMSPPIVNWAAPQFFNAPYGAFSSDGSFGTKPSVKQGGAFRTLATFIPITPCRLVDTRNFFTPVYAGNDEVNPDPTPRPFNGSQANTPPTPNGEFRTYKVAGNCGIPPGNNRITAVSVAVTTLPTAVSGDVEVVAAGSQLGKTVLMVIQQQLWNSATTETPVDSQGRFTIQMRIASGDMAIDVNGYYVVMDAANTSDYFSVVGNYSLDGGLFNVTQTGAGNTLGAAISAVAPGSEVHLANSNALDIVIGGIRVRQNGSPSNSAAYVFDTTGRRCADLVSGTTTLARLDNTQVTATAGLMLFVQPRNVAASSKPAAVVNGTCANPSDPTPDGWYLYNAGGFTGGEQYNVLIIHP